MNYFRMLLEKQILKEELKNHFSTIINGFISYKKFIDENLKGKIKSDLFEYVDLIYDEIEKNKMKLTVKNFLDSEKDIIISKFKFFEILNLKLINNVFYTKHINFCNKMVDNYDNYDIEISKLMLYYNKIANKNNVAVLDYKEEGGLKEVFIFPLTYEAERKLDMKTGKRY